MAKEAKSWWNPTRRFTEAEYEEYSNLPRWALDSPDFDTKDKWHAHWTDTILQWVSQAKRAQSKWKATCRDALRRIEEVEDGTNRVYSLERSVAFKPMKLAKASIEEGVAMLCLNPPQGIIVGKQESEGQYVAASNNLLDKEQKVNAFEKTFNDTVNSAFYWRLGWWKLSVDYERFGLQGQRGRICIDRIDPNSMHVDPECKELKWDNMKYVIQEEEHEIGEIRESYPLSGFQIDDHTDSSRYSSVLDERQQDKITSPIPKLGRQQASKRQKIKTYEAWFKDTRLKFIADKDAKGDLMLDDEDFVVGEWVPMYPKGRCVVICEDIVMEDMPNRLPHGHCPFIPVELSPADEPFTPGPACDIIDIADKMNDIMGRSHAYGQSEWERPMECEMGTFVNAQYYKRVPNASNKMLVLGQGKSGTLMRRAAVELPEFTWTMLSKYETYMDLMAGSSAITRGELPADGKQLASDTVASMQQFASSRVALRAKYLKSAVIELIYQLHWLIRRVYDEAITFTFSTPDGQNEEFDWESDKQIFESGDEEEIAKLLSQEDYLVEVRAGTGQPNAQEARMSQADHLHDRGAVDNEYLLDAYEVPGRQGIVKRIKDRENELVTNEALGRKIGMNIVKAEKKADGPGRKEKF